MGVGQMPTARAKMMRVIALQIGANNAGKIEGKIDQKRRRHCRRNAWHEYAF